MAEWKEMTVKKAPFEIIDGDRGKNYPSHDEFHNEGYCLFLSTRNVRQTGFDFSYCQFITHAKDELLRKGKLRKHDIVLTTRGTVGNLAYYGNDVPFENIRINSGMVIVRPDEGKMESIFCYYLFRYLQKSFETFTSGSAQPQLPIRDLNEMVILLPELPEQRTIASILITLDDKIDLLHRQNKTLEALAETLFRQWFPPSQELRRAGVDEAEEGWEKGKLGDVISIYDNVRKPVSSMEREKMKTGQLYPYYGAATIMDYVNEYIFDGEYILMGEDGTVQTEDGYPILQLPTGKFWVNNHAHIFQAKEPYSNFFIYIFLKRTNISHIVTGAVQPKINQENLKLIEFSIAPEEKIQTFVSITNDYWNKINSNNFQIRTLAQLRDTLLPKLMSGEVRLKEFVADITTAKTSVGTIYTIGHSNHTIDKFISLLKKHEIKVVADVRSTPYSRLHPQFNREVLKKALNASKIQYVFMGNELGARPNDPSVYVNNAVQYARLAERIDFRNGIERLIKGIKEHKIALMCTEKDPVNCHRTILVGRNLKKLGVSIQHILYNSELEENSKTEERLIKMEGFTPTLFNTDIDQIEIIEKVYDQRSTEIAYIREPEEEKYGTKK